MGITDWPLDEEGTPMAMITMGASEKIGMPHYSNVDLGPASVTRFVKNTRVDIKEGLREAVLICEEVIGEERGEVVKVMKEAIGEGMRP